MDERARRALIELLRDEGCQLVEDEQRLRELLANRLNGMPRELRVLSSAVEQGIPAAQRHAPQPYGFEDLRRETVQLQEATGLSASAAWWAIESWALALGRIQEPMPKRTVDSEIQPPASIGAKPTPHGSVVDVVDADIVETPGGDARVPATRQPGPPPSSPDPFPPPGRRTTLSGCLARLLLLALYMLTVVGLISYGTGFATFLWNLLEQEAGISW